MLTSALLVLHQVPPFFIWNEGLSMPGTPTSSGAASHFPPPVVVGARSLARANGTERVNGIVPHSAQQPVACCALSVPDWGRPGNHSMSRHVGRSNMFSRFLDEPALTGMVQVNHRSGTAPVTRLEPGSEARVSGERCPWGQPSSLPQAWFSHSSF